MSDISDAIRQALSSPSKEGKVKELIEARKPPPGWEPLQRWTAWNTARIIRPARFFFNGRKPWETAEEAEHDVTAFVNDSVFSFMLSAIAKGMIAIIGMDVLPEDYEWEELFTHAGEPRWLAAQAEAEMFLKEDDDVMEVIREHLQKHTEFFTTVSNFKAAKDKATLHIFDILNDVLKAASTTAYIAGLATGEVCKEQMVLEEMEKEISGSPE